MDVGRLEATLVDVVEGECLSRVSAVFVHLYHSSSASLRLLLLSSGCHDFRKCESHGNTHTIAFSFTHAHLSGGACLKGLHWGEMVLCKWDGPGPYSVVGPPYSSAAWTVSLHASPQSQYTSGHNTPERKKGTRYKIKGDVTAAYYQKATIRHVVDSGMSHSPVC